MEILLEKATGRGHIWSKKGNCTKKKQVILHGNSFGKGYVHWTRITKKGNCTKKKTSYFTWKFFWKRLRSLDTNYQKGNCTKKKKLFYMEIVLEKATFTGHELPKKVQQVILH